MHDFFGGGGRSDSFCNTEALEPQLYRTVSALCMHNIKVSLYIFIFVKFISHICENVFV